MNVLFVLIAALIFLKLNRFYQFLVLSLASLLPFSLGDFRSIPNLMIIEWLPFVVALMLVNDLVSVNKLQKKINTISFKGIGIFIFALVILIIWLVHSFIENEIFLTNIYIQEISTKRMYFSIFNNIVLFFVTILFVVTYYPEIDFESYFKSLLYISIFLGFFRLASHFFDFNIPLLYGEFKYGGEYGYFSKLKYGGTALRLGGLTDISAIGIAAYFAYYVFKHKLNLIILGIFVFFLFLSGGRTVLAGAIFAVILFSFLFFPKNFMYMFFLGVFSIILAFIFLPDDLLVGQLGRITTFSKDTTIGVDVSRNLGWKVMLDEFIKYPFWGKGLGVKGTIPLLFKFNETIVAFVQSIFFFGGHGSYLSVAGILGIGGIIYFLIMLVGGIIMAYKKISFYLNINNSYVAISVFTFMLLVIKAFDFITAKNGLNVPILFFVVGLVASVTVLKNKEEMLK
ncbi:MAG: hypothetical protein CR986_06875 [Ignavibacteriae bacterium]|nr:MAG: hypothetical protein CR986_06875 [Ignavibacteriota bacterium]